MLSKDILHALQLEMANISLSLNDKDKAVWDQLKHDIGVRLAGQVGQSRECARATSAELNKWMTLCAAKNDEEFSCLLEYFAVRSKLCSHIESLPSTNSAQCSMRQVKLDLLNQVDHIFFDISASSYEEQLARVSLLTQVIDATAEIHMTEYNQLIAQVSQQSWCAGLDAIMSIVSLNALLAPVTESLTVSDDLDPFSEACRRFAFN